MNRQGPPSWGSRFRTTSLIEAFPLTGDAGWIPASTSARFKQAERILEPALKAEKKHRRIRAQVQNVLGSLRKGNVTGRGREGRI